LKHVTINYTGKTEQEPHYASDEAAGADLRADLESAVTLEPGKRALIPTGLFMEIPRGYEGQVRPRSGLAWKHGITVLNSPGTIDSDYRGEVKVILINLSDQAFDIKPNERIAQLVICPVTRGEFCYTDILNHTHRGEGGFGSTGKA